MSRIQEWWHNSNANKSKGGMIFMVIAGAVFLGMCGLLISRFM